MVVMGGRWLEIVVSSAHRFLFKCWISEADFWVVMWTPDLGYMTRRRTAGKAEKVGNIMGGQTRSPLNAPPVCSPSLHVLSHRSCSLRIVSGIPPPSTSPRPFCIEDEPTNRMGGFPQVPRNTTLDQTTRHHPGLTDWESAEEARKRRDPIRLRHESTV